MLNKKLPILYIVIPCYNEEKVLPITAPLFLKKLNSLIENERISPKSRILFVNDGSKDKTWNIIVELSKNNEKYLGISQSRNKGHQSTLLAGLMEAIDKCDITISIDCDGQDDIEAMSEMIDEFYNGAEVVYGVRSKRNTDTFFKRESAELFYKILKFMGAEVVFNHADYRLVSTKVLKEFKNFEEVNIYLRGMFPLVGFKSTSVYYERNERIAGESHYPLKKMLALAFDGITSLTIKPIRLITIVGLIISGISFALIVYVLISYILGIVIRGWSSTLSIVCFLGGVQLISIGIIGEYIGKIYLETKRRPRYIISEKTYKDKNDI